MIIAVTGHRSNDCEPEEVVRKKFRDALEPHQTSVLITGMANGVDLWAADEARLLGIEIWAAKPWSGHGPREGDEELYERIIDAASKVVDVTEQDEYPGPWCYHKRNEWMVDHATHVLAYWSGKKSGGTFACCNYAKKKEVPVRNIYAQS